MNYSVFGLSALMDRIQDWAIRALGDDVALDPKERAKRVLEEALELAQAEGVSYDEAKDLNIYVYSRSVGEPTQELAGLGLCVLAYARAKDYAFLGLVIKELDRIDTPEMIKRVRFKHDIKVQAGLSMRRTTE
jgi:hypothetical protein